MTNEILPHRIDIENKIVIIRGQQVIIDRDLARFYGVGTKVLNQAVKRNIERFPEEFCFQLNKEEFENWKSQFVTSNSDKMGLRRPPYAFTEQGVAMLSAVLKSDTAITASIQIMHAFVFMRRFLQNNSKIFVEIDSIKRHQIESDKRIDELFDKMDRYKIEDRQGIFFQGQIFDAYAKFESFIQSAAQEIVLIDNYIDESVLTLLDKRGSGVTAEIYTHTPNAQLQLDIQRHNSQYTPIPIHVFAHSHDRFLCIDDTVYHIGASLKDLGKKCFAFEVLDSAWIKEILKNL